MGPAPSTPVQCTQCGVPVTESLRHCPSCGNDLGFPNVRAATEAIEVNALMSRYKDALANADKRGLSKEFAALVLAVNSNSHVVVAMPLLYARTFLIDPRTLYGSYEGLMGAGIRLPAPFINDSDRHAVSGKLFASYASDIRYGVLSLDAVGLSNYGLVFVRLRDVAIEQRVSFLHENSYLFMDALQVPVRGTLPHGFRCNWQNRDKLVAAKIEPILLPGSTETDWARQLVAQGANREEDRCVEAHIFGTFNAESVASIEFAGPGSSREERNDIDSIKEFMERRGPGGGKS